MRLRDVAELSVYQQGWLDALFRGYARLSDGTSIYSHLFFAGLRILFQNLATGEKASRLRAALREDHEWSPSWNAKIKAIEHLEANDRFELALLAGRVLADWPQTFIALCRQAGIVASDLIGPIKNVPFWYFSVIDQHFSGGVYSPTLPEIGSAIAYLRQRNMGVTKTSVSRILGGTDVIRKRQLNWLLDA